MWPLSSVTCKPESLFLVLSITLQILERYFEYFVNSHRGASETKCPLCFISSSPSSLHKPHKDIIAFTTLLARRLILITWKSSRPPSHTRWTRDILYLLRLEKICLSTIGLSNKFNFIWGPFFQYIERMRFPQSDLGVWRWRMCDYVG